MPGNYTLKEIPFADLKEAVSLIWSVFSEFEAPDYGDEGIEAFKRFIAYDSLKEKVESAGIFLTGCYDEGQLAGVIGYTAKFHIALLFVRKRYQKQGIASALLNKMLDQRERAGDLFEVTVNSSPYAHEIYHKLGFVDTNTERIVNGIRFYPMKYPLK